MSAAANRPLGRTDPVSSGSRQLVILFADDDDKIRNLVTTIMQMDGYAVFTCADGQEALELVEDLDIPIDLAITDLEMPRMNGAEFCLHARERRPDLKIVVISGTGDHTRPSHIRDLPFFPKPLDFSSLKVTVRELVSGQG